MIMILRRVSFFMPVNLRESGSDARCRVLAQFHSCSSSRHVSGRDLHEARFGKMSNKSISDLMLEKGKPQNCFVDWFLADPNHKQYEAYDGTSSTYKTRF